MFGFWTPRFGEVALTSHAQDRMRERGIDDREVQETLDHGAWEGRAGAWRVTRGGHVVVVSDDGVVKTTFRRDR